MCSPPGCVHRGVGPLGHPQGLRFSRGLLQPEDVITRNPVFQGTFDLSGKRVNVRPASPPAPGAPSEDAQFVDTTGPEPPAHMWLHLLGCGLWDRGYGRSLGGPGQQLLPLALQDSLQIQTQGCGEQGVKRGGPAPRAPGWRLDATNWGPLRDSMVGPVPGSCPGHPIPQQVGDTGHVLSMAPESQMCWERGNGFQTVYGSNWQKK